MSLLLESLPKIVYSLILLISSVRTNDHVCLTGQCSKALTTFPVTLYYADRPISDHTGHGV
jgi:hypothetical protein